MSHLPPDDDATSDTERFALQACPHCRAVAPVPLAVSMTRCESCGGDFEVAPLSPDETTRCAIPNYEGIERILGEPRW